jgi:peptidylprolyl isomerase
MSPTRNILMALTVVLAAAGLYTIYRGGAGPVPVTPVPVVEAPAPAPSPDGPDLGLRIEVAGEANGTVVVDLFEDVAPGHAARIAELAREGAYDGVVFHRVIDGFMAQTGDVEFGDVDAEEFDMRRAGMGGSALPDLAAEFSEIPFERGIVGMARSQDPDSANSQFFIMFQPGPFLNNQYTVVGEGTEGMEVVDAIKRGAERANGAVTGAPDRMVRVTVTED